MAGAVDGEGEGDHALAPRLRQRHLGVVDRVFLFGAVAPVAVVLGAAVGEQDQDLDFRVSVLEFPDAVADGGAHAGGADGGDLVDPLLDLVAEGFLHVLVDEEFDVVAAVAGEAVDAVLVADGFEGFDQEHDGFFFEVDDPLAGVAGLFGAALRPPREVLAGVVVELVVVLLLVLLLDFLVGAGGDVEQEGDGDVAFDLVAAVEELGFGGGAGDFFGVPLDHGVEIVIFAVGQALDFAEEFGAQHFELLAGLLDELGVLVECGVVVADIAGFAALLLDAAPAGLVIGGAEVPFVVVEGLRFDGQLAVVFLAGRVVAHGLLAFLSLALDAVDFLEQVVEEHAGGFGEVHVHDLVDRDFDALFEQLLELLLGERDRGGVAAAGFALELHQQLDQFGLEVAAEVDRVGAVVGAFFGAGHGGHVGLFEAAGTGTGQHLLVGVLALAGRHFHVEVGPVSGFEFDVGDVGDPLVEQAGGGGGVLDGRAVLADAVEHAKGGLHGFGEFGGPADAAGVVEAGSEQVFDHRLAGGHLLDRPAAVGGGGLEAVEGLADAGVLALDDGVDAGVLDDGEDVVGELAVLELVEELLHVGVDRLFGVIAPRGCAVGSAVFGGGEDLRGAVGLVLEGAEFEAAGLVGGEDLVNAEVVFLVLVALDHFG